MLGSVLLFFGVFWCSIWGFRVFEPAMANGNGWAAAFVDGEWRNGQQQAGDLGLFAAGPRMGKSATVGGWWNKHKLPFARSVVVAVSVVPRSAIEAARLASAGGAAPCTSADFIVRGYETTAPTASVALPSGVVLPRTARIGLARVEPAQRVEAYALAELAKIPAGRQGVIYLVNLALEASPPWGTNSANGGRVANHNNYVEGCWHFQRTATEPLPAMVVGTGLEDCFDSAFGFSIIGPDPADPTASSFSRNIQRSCNGTINPSGSLGPTVCEREGVLFQHETSGVLHFSTDSTDNAAVSPELNRSSLGVERLSAYRFLNHEVLAFEDGGALLWRNSDHEPKCRASATEGVPKPNSHAIMVRSYVWYYHWPK